jgi:DNA-binding CsgD family transcriptional regulator
VAGCDLVNRAILNPPLALPTVMMNAPIIELAQIPVNVVVLDALGTIVAVNEGWERFGQENGLQHPRSCIGENYLETCRAASAPPELIDDLENLLQGRRTTMARWYPCHAPHRRRWFLLFGLHDERSGPATTTLFHIEATALVTERTIERLEEERPDISTPEHAVERSLAAALSRVLPAMLTGLQTDAPDQDHGARALGREEVRTVTKALTKRQLEVLLLVGTGKSNAEIGEALSASPNTIKLHVSAILKRLALETRAQAVVLGAKLKARHL